MWAELEVIALAAYCPACAVCLSCIVERNVFYCCVLTA